MCLGQRTPIVSCTLLAKSDTQRHLYVARCVQWWLGDAHDHGAIAVVRKDTSCVVVVCAWQCRQGGVLSDGAVVGYVHGSSDTRIVVCVRGSAGGDEVFRYSDTVRWYTAGLTADASTNVIAVPQARMPSPLQSSAVLWV